MKRSYLLVYNNQLGTRDQVKEALNHSPIITWRYDMPNSFYLISESSAREIAGYLKDKLGSGRFIVSEIENNYWGFGSKETWHLIKNKELKSKK